MTGSVDLETQLNALCADQPFFTSWYLKDLVSGRALNRSGGQPVPSASTRKTSVLMAALKAVQEGRLNLDEPVTVEKRYQVGVASGTFHHMTPGLVIPLRDALVQMIITSDNVCTQLVIDRLDLDGLNDYCRSLGMTRTVHRHTIPPLGMPWDHPLEATTTTTAHDQGLLLDLILRGTHDDAAARRLGCTAEHCRYAIEVLSWQCYRQMLPGLLPYGTKVAHKTGRGARGRMDAGIVFRDEQPLFILTAFTDKVPEEMPDGLPGYAAAFSLIARLSRLCWDTIGRMG